ncbi:MAG: hypothetical protein FJY34_05675 [Betaproteobacteria bacterium]|nr:hypothetical protein [Betaproteobacteria bacterium]
MQRKRIDLAEILGREWEDIYIGADGLLYLPGWRRGFEAGDLKAIFYDNQERYRLKHEAARLTRELERLQEALDQAEKSVWWYRRQMKLEASLGLMLARVAA